MLKLDNIKVNYGKFEVLRGISLEIEQGEIVALLGSNGAGKTTTINTIMGLNSLKEGDILLDGVSIRELPTHERVQKGIVICPEGRRLFPYMSVYDNMLVGSYSPHARKKRAENIEMCFQLFPKLKERRNQLARTLSGGEQQMCAIARALMACPEVLILDEPSLGLAPVIVQKIFEILEQINKMGVTIMLVEQNVMSSLEIASRGYIIETGENVVAGTAEELLGSEDVKKAYLGI
ncbi:MAG: ABC transporter ATP-binding protein [Lachnospiraceae bacterium]|nr:ABC transporter ATP-binding protein [Lachnospiraceae bacterium]